MLPRMRMLLIYLFGAVLGVVLHQFLGLWLAVFMSLTLFVAAMFVDAIGYDRRAERQPR